MEAHIEYNNQPVSQGLLDVGQLSDLAIEASNADGYFFYLIVRTSLGTSTIVTCGPIEPDIQSLPSGYAVTLTKMRYNDSKVCGMVSKWLNDKKAITDARVVPVDDALAQIRNVGEYMRNYDDACEITGTHERLR